MMLITKKKTVAIIVVISVLAVAGYVVFSGEQFQSSWVWNPPEFVYDSRGFCAGFPGGRIGAITTLGEDVYEIGGSGWFNFYKKDIKGKHVKFILTNQRVTDYPEWKVPYTYDGYNWGRIENTYVEGETTVFEHTFTQDVVQFSYWYAYSYDRAQALMHDVASYYANAEVSTVGHTELGRDIDTLEITNWNIPESEKKQIFITCRHHANEPVPSFIAEETIKYIMSNSDYQDKFHWYFTLMINADGVTSTCGRCTSSNNDANRAWNLYNVGDCNTGACNCLTCCYCEEIVGVRDKFDEVNSEYGVDFFFDMHAQPGGLESFIYDASGTNWCSMFVDETDGRYYCRAGSPPVGSSRWYGTENGVMSATSEPSQVSNSYTFSSYKDDGEGLARSIYGYFFD